MKVINYDIVTLLKGSDASSRGKAEEMRPRQDQGEASKRRGEAEAASNDVAASRQDF